MIDKTNQEIAKIGKEIPYKFSKSEIAYSKFYSGFPYHFFDFLDIWEFLTNFGNSDFENTKTGKGKKQKHSLLRI